MKFSAASPSSNPNHSATRQNRAQKERDAIMADIRSAAIAEFSLHGLKGASTQSIAKRANLKQSQLYYYISSKEALYESLLQSVLQDWAVLFVFDASSDDPATVLRTYIRRKLLYAFQKPELSRIFTREVLGGGALLEKHWTEASSSAQHKVEQLEGWMNECLIRMMDARLLLMHIWALTQHYADFDIQVRAMITGIGGLPYDEDHIISEVTNFVLNACGLPDLSA
ncbi:MAG: TetR family transcriptional regulator [Herbaspirillum sp.]|nr:TetR family transcriptional regulator [Herbaspirillum sp.]